VSPTAVSSVFGVGTDLIVAEEKKASGGWYGIGLSSFSFRVDEVNAYPTKACCAVVNYRDSTLAIFMLMTS
jgi:hypothetical protein